MTDPENCRDMAEVRAGIDALDRELIALLGRRFRFMDAAARIKTARGDVRDETRKAAVIAQAKAAATQEGVPEALVGQIWETLVEGSIAYELARFDAIKA